MKAATSSRNLIPLLAACASLLAVPSLHAGDTGATSAPEVTEPQNWVNFGLGGLILHGDHGQAAHQLRMSDNLFGGIEDLHVESALGNDFVLKLDGHAMPGNNDYLGQIEISKEDVGYLRAGYSQYRTWYDGNGGFLPLSFGNGLFLSPERNVLGLDRGQIFFELGLRDPNLPSVTFRYERDTRHGQKDSTSWGDTTLPGGNGRKIAPAFRDINEVRDIFSLDLAHSLGKTDVALGIRYEHENNGESYNVTLNPKEPSAAKVSQNEGTQGDMFTAHGSAVTRLNDKIWFTLGYAVTTYNTDISGSRVYGKGYDPEIDPTGTPFAYAGEGFYRLFGGSEWGQHLANLNFMWKPSADLSILAGARFESKRTDSTATFTLSEPLGGAYDLTRFLENSSDDTTRFTESLELRYTGLQNWVFFTRGEWTEETGAVMDQVTNLADPTDSDFADIDRERTIQKYTLGANWYACQRATVNVQYYHKIDDIHYSNSAIPDGPPAVVGLDVGFPGRLAGQFFHMDDLKSNVLIRVLPNLSLASQYDYQLYKISTDSFGLGMVESGKTTRHVFSESLTWTPISRLYLQASASYYISKTATPATLDTVAAGSQKFDLKNDYLTLCSSAGFAVDEKTSLRADYTFYKANNYEDVSKWTVPYGAGAEQHTVTLGLNRQICSNVSASLKGGYYLYSDQTSGQHNNYSGFLLYSGLQVRF